MELLHLLYLLLLELVVLTLLLLLLLMCELWRLPLAAVVAAAVAFALSGQTLHPESLPPVAKASRPSPKLRRLR